MGSLYGMQKEMKNYVKIVQKRFEEYARRFPRGHWSFLGPGSGKKWYATYSSKPNGCWDRTAEKIMQNFRRSGHPIFSLCQSLGERTIKKQRRRKDNNTFHSQWWTKFSCLWKMVFSVNQLSLHGAAADLIEELPDDQRAPGNLLH